MNYKIKAEFKSYSGSDAWSHVTDHVEVNKCFYSVTGIKYDARVVDDSVLFQGGSGKGRGSKGETLSKEKFIYAYNEVIHLDSINTKKVKPYIDRQQSPFVGLLLSAGILYKY